MGILSSLEVWSKWRISIDPSTGALSGGCIIHRGWWTVVGETTDLNELHCLCTSEDLVVWWWAVFWVFFLLVPLCQWILGWWSLQSLVCLDLCGTIFMTLASLLQRRVAVHSELTTHAAELDKRLPLTCIQPRLHNSEYLSYSFLFFFFHLAMPLVFKRHQYSS